MKLLLLFCAVALLVGVPVLSLAKNPDPGRNKTAMRHRAAKGTGLPAGKWRVEFANGVIETCEIRGDGTATVVEPARTAAGKAAFKEGATVIVFQDDRTERWTRIGKRRLVVQHWFPGSQFPAGEPVLGIATRGDKAKRAKRNR